MLLMVHCAIKKASLGSQEHHNRVLRCSWSWKDEVHRLYKLPNMDIPGRLSNLGWACPVDHRPRRYLVPDLSFDIRCDSGSPRFYGFLYRPMFATAMAKLWPLCHSYQLVNLCFSQYLNWENWQPASYLLHTSTGIYQVSYLSQSSFYTADVTFLEFFGFVALTFKIQLRSRGFAGSATSGLKP